MRSNIVSEAGLPTRVSQWWGGVPFITSGVVILCGIIYLVCLMVGYDSFVEICFLPSAVISHFQVYRLYTAIFFHASILHFLFNMMAFVPLGSGLERIMGSVRLLHVIFLLATSNGIVHLLIALLVEHNPIHPYPYLMNECAVGFSGVMFSMIVMETTLSGVESRSVFGLFSVPAKWYPWILLIVFQILMIKSVSLLGHLSGILSGFAYAHGFFNYLLPGPSFYSAIESSALLSAFVRRPGFILCTGGAPYGQLPTYSSPTTGGLVSGNLWRNLSSWVPQTGVAPDQPAQDSRFPGRGRTLASGQTQVNSDSVLHARLLDNCTSDQPVEPVALSAVQSLPDGRHSPVAGALSHSQDAGTFDQVVQNLVVMGFDKTQAEVALAAAEGDPNVAVEILMSQQQAST